MRKKNLSVKVAALAMSGTLAMAPMTVRAEEAGTPATESTGTTAAANTSAAAPAAAAAAAPTTATTPAATTAAAPVTITEPAADPGTTAPNNVENVVGDDK